MLITQNADLVSANVLFLFELYLLEKYTLYVDNDNNILSCPNLNIKVSLEQKYDQINQPCNTEMKIL